jgi:3-(3-hydroxy-phenyl)propionate hydroxylase
MLAARGSDGRPPAAVGAPPLAAGLLLSGTASAGEAFPQPWTAAGARLDDALGPGAWLISRGGALPESDVMAFGLDEPALAAFAAGIGAWLDSRGAQAVLVRPDRYVFGTGEAASLALAWNEALAAGAAGP